MSKKKKLWRFPVTLCGVALGLLVGGGAVIKELYGKEHPTVGLIVMGASPLMGFIFEQVMRTAFPEAYWEKIAGNIYWLIRYIKNESFRMRLTYELRFPLKSIKNFPNDITSEAICDALNAAPGSDPEPTYIGKDYIHLRFSRVPFYVALEWSVREPDDDTDEEAETVFVVKMEPETRDFVLRNAQTDIEALSVRIRELQQKLTNHFMGVQPETLATADAWFGSPQPPATPIPRARTDAISGAGYRLFPGRLRISGESVDALGAVCRYIKIVEPPPDEEDSATK